MKNYGIILASGSGERSGLDIPKQFLKIGGKTILEHTIEIFESNPNIDNIILVSHKNYIDLCKDIIVKNNYKKVLKILAGGQTRRESSSIGIMSIEEKDVKVLIHDAVRPFLSNKIINDCIDALKKYDAVDVAIKTADTIIKINEKNIIEEIPQRKFYRRGQTPQAFDLNLIKKAHVEAAKIEGIDVTDDCGLVTKLNLAPVYVVEGDEYNIKVTYPLDVAIADKLFQLKQSSTPKIDLSNLASKVVVVFGASKGIGKSICDFAKQHGAKVYGYSRSNGVNVCDFDKVKEVLDNVMRENEKIDYIVNTAGLLKMGKINCREISDIREEVEINYIGSLNIAKLAPEYLKSSKGALLFFTSSSYTRGRSLYSIYSSTKAALVNLTQALAEEWQQEEIRVNIINPERTATPMRRSNFGLEPENTLLKPEKVAEVALKVLLSGYSGQVIDVRREKGIIS